MRVQRASLRFAAVPVGVALGAAAWLIPVVAGGPVYRQLAYEAAGVLVTQGIWFVWSLPLAVLSASVARTGRRLGPAWTALQVVLLVDVVVRLLGPLLVAVPAAAEVLTSGPALTVVPVLALLLLALQGLALFLRA